MAGTRPPVADPTGSAAALAPPWAVPVAGVALLVGAVLAALVWHATRLDPVDEWVMRWQERADSYADRPAEIISATLPVGLMLVTMVAGAALATLAGRRDAAVLALSAAPATVAAELLLKGLVHRQWNGDPDLLFPSGHVAAATATAMTAVLVLRVAPVAPRVRIAAASLAGGLLLVVAVARLVETVHSLTDVVGGGATGLVVSLGAAWAITAWCRRPHLRDSSGDAAVIDDAPAPSGGPPAGVDREVVGPQDPAHRLSPGPGRTGAASIGPLTLDDGAERLQQDVQVEGG